MEDFHISATGHSLNYLPQYIAQRRGFFKEQNLEVHVTVPSPWDRVLDDLASGTANAALGGIWVPSMYRNRATSHTVFAQLANRSPLALVKRGSSVGFQVTETLGRTVLMKSGNGASVGLFFKMVLRENGVDPNAVHYVQDLDGVMLGKLFQGGLGDYFVVDNVTARVMTAQNPHLSVAMEMVTDSDDIPWSVYYQETARAPSQIDAQARFCVALKKGMDWVLQHDAESFREEIAEIFPKIPTDIAVSLANVYRRNGMWTSPTVNRTAFARWQLGMSDGRLIEKPFSYEDIVSPGPAEAACKAELEPTNEAVIPLLLKNEAAVEVQEVQDTSVAA